jgi:hypothetical protein
MVVVVIVVVVVVVVVGIAVHTMDPASKDPAWQDGWSPVI